MGPWQWIAFGYILGCFTSPLLWAGWMTWRRERRLRAAAERQRLANQKEQLAVWRQSRRRRPRPSSK